MALHRLPVALQLYTVRDQAQENLEQTLQAVSEIGYTAVELAGLYGHSAQILRALLDRYQLSVASAHVSMPDIRANLDGLIDTYQALGSPAIVCAALPREERDSADGFRRAGEDLARAGQRCQERGILFGYHNHDFEFVHFGDELAMDLLLAASSPATVGLELDVYWASYSGNDPAAYLRSQAKRVLFIHVKDMTHDEARTFAEVGEGQIDFAPIFAAAAETSARAYIVEQDRCQQSPLQSIAVSLGHLREWGIA